MNSAFLSPLRVELIDPYHSDGSGLWRYTEILSYRSVLLRKTIEISGTTDFGSVPKLPLIYANFGNRYHRATGVHDWLCAQDVKRSMADRVFLEAMRVENDEEITQMKSRGLDDDEILDRKAAIEGRAQSMYLAVLMYSKVTSWK
jgi:hypothetical protein